MKKLLLILILGLTSVLAFSQGSDVPKGVIYNQKGFQVGIKKDQMIFNQLDKTNLSNSKYAVPSSSATRAYLNSSYLTDDYEAILTQSGSAAPKDTAWNNSEAYNLLGGTKTWVRASAGTYELRDSSANFTVKNTIVNITPQVVSVSDSSMYVINYAITNPYKITFTTYLQRYGYTKVRTLTDGIIDRKRVLIKKTR